MRKKGVLVLGVMVAAAALGIYFAGRRKKG